MNKIYQVKESDLIGDIEGFPIEVVQKMVDYQVAQKCFVDISVFQLKGRTTHSGFSWAKTEEGFLFWDSVISRRQFDVFFKKYPKKIIMDYEVYKVTRRQMEQIHSIACALWKSKIAKLTDAYFMTFSDEAYLPHSVVKEMFDAATVEQQKVLKSIFIDYNKKVITEGTFCNGIR